MTIDEALRILPVSVLNSVASILHDDREDSHVEYLDTLYARVIAQVER